jgi:hypothetical protein
MGLWVTFGRGVNADARRIGEDDADLEYTLPKGTLSMIGTAPQANGIPHDIGPRVRVEAQHWIILVLIILLGTVLRLIRLNAQSVWYDESFSVAHSGRSLVELFKILASDVVHPPLHYLVLHGWFDILGFGVTQARLLSAVFGTLSIPLTFMLTRRFHEATTSLCAAFLLAMSQTGVYFSQEARPYAQAQFLSLVVALAFISFLRQPDFRKSMSLAVASMALLYTHYYASATLVALFLFWMIFRRDYSPLVFRRLAVIAVLLGVAQVPWIIVLQTGGKFNRQRVIQRARPANERPNALSLITAVNRFNNLKLESIEGPTTLPEALLGFAVFTLPVVGALCYTRRSRPHGVVLGCLLAAIPVVMTILMGAAGAIFNYRHYSFALPGYYMAVAIGWRVCMRNRGVRLAWLALVIAIAGFALRANYFVPTKPDYRQGLLPLAKAYQAGDCVAGLPSVWKNRVHFAWEVYYRDTGNLRLAPLNPVVAASMHCDRLWVVWDRTWWMNQDKESTQESIRAIAKLSDQYKVVERYDHPAIELQLLKRQYDSAGQ